jgi:hypothetical protein
MLFGSSPPSVAPANPADPDETIAATMTSLTVPTNQRLPHHLRNDFIMRHPLARSLSASRITPSSPCAIAPDFSILFNASFTSGCR